MNFSRSPTALTLAFALGLTACNPVDAGPIGSQDEFREYLKKTVFSKPYSIPFRIDQPFRTQSVDGQHRRCDLGALDRADPVYRILHAVGVISVEGKLVKDRNSISVMTNYCEYTVNTFDKNKLEGSAIKQDDGSYRLSLVEQKFLGFESYRTHSSMDQRRCGIFSEILIGNGEVSAFVQKHRSRFERTWLLKEIFKKDVSGTFCGTPLEDGTMKWGYASRL